MAEKEALRRIWQRSMARLEKDLMEQRERIMRMCMYYPPEKPQSSTKEQEHG